MNAGDREIMDHFTVTREKTKALARQMPEKLLVRTAAGEDNPLDWLFIHIADGVDWWMHNVIHDGQGPSPPYERDNESILQALDASHARLISFFTAKVMLALATDRINKFPVDRLGLECLS